MAGKKILIIDNDPEFVNASKAALESDGYQVSTAVSGQEGMGRVTFEKPDLIILELSLEQHDTGFDFAKKVKADPRYKGTRILMTSSAGESCSFCQDLDGYWMKTDDFAAKPVAPETLIKKVKDLLA